MKRNILAILLLFLVALFVACEKEIKFNGKITEPFLVMNAYLNTDSLVKIHVSKSQFILGEITDGDLHIDNAEVKLYVNGEFKENLKSIGTGYYSGTYLPKAEDVIKVEVLAGGFKSIEAMITIPNKPNLRIESVKEEIVKYDSTTTDYRRGKTFKIVTANLLLDEPDSHNFYSTHTYHKANEQYRDYIEMYMPLSDILAGYIKETEGSSMIDFLDINVNPVTIDEHYFNDFLFNGKQVRLKYTFEIMLDGGILYGEKNNSGTTMNSKTKNIYRISFATIAEENFKFLLSSERARKAEDKVFSEPVRIYSNVSSGAGLLGAYNSENIEIVVDGE